MFQDKNVDGFYTVREPVVLKEDYDSTTSDKVYYDAAEGGNKVITASAGKEVFQETGDAPVAGETVQLSQWFFVPADEADLTPKVSRGAHAAKDFCAELFRRATLHRRRESAVRAPFFRKRKD